MTQDLLNRFIVALNYKTGNKRETASQIADILKIEKESAYRRLNGKVQFTVREMGLLAKAMNVSIDHLLYSDSEKLPLLFQVGMNSVEHLEIMMEDAVSNHEKIKSPDMMLGTVFNTLPVELFSQYPLLERFMFFKWEHMNAPDMQFTDFSSWQLPEKISEMNARLKDNFRSYKKVLYIWDKALIANLMNEIQYYATIQLLTPEDVKLIKDDLHSLLDQFQSYLRSGESRPYGIKDIDFEVYVTHLNVAVVAFYVWSGDTYLSGIKTPFLQSCTHRDYKTGYKIYEWINSLKRVSSLISGSGEKERILFIKGEHEIVDSI